MQGQFGFSVNTWLKIASAVLAVLVGVFSMVFAYAYQEKLAVMIQVSLGLSIVLTAAFSGTLAYVVVLRKGIEERKNDLPLVGAAVMLGLLVIEEGEVDPQNR